MILYEHDSNSAAFWFAGEEYIMRSLRPSEPVLMLWSTGDTIMLGANQIAEVECDVAYAEAERIEIVRRSSGGGTIFTDAGTLQVTVILPAPYFTESEEPPPRPEKTEEPSPRLPARDPKEVAREWLAVPVIETLDRLGADASLEGRNDILIDGKKISGLAQYVKDGYICSHCSILFRTDLEKLTRCLTVDRSKFTTKAIASTKSRVTNVTGHIPEHDMESFRAALVETYGVTERREFGPYQRDEIGAFMRDKYLSPDWTYGHEPAFTFKNSKSFPGGTLEVFLNVKGGVIQDARISGDFLSLRPVAELEEKLIGLPHSGGPIALSLRSFDVKSYLGSLGYPELLQVLSPR